VVCLNRKMHCSVMGREALDAAIEHYRGGKSGKKLLDGKVVCTCFGVTEEEILPCYTREQTHVG